MLIGQRMSKLPNIYFDFKNKKPVKKSITVNPIFYKEARFLKIKNISSMLRSNDFGHLIIVIIIILISVFTEETHYYLYYLDKDFSDAFDRYLNNTIGVLNLVCFLLLPLNIFFIINHYKLLLEYQKSKKYINYRKTIFSKEIITKIVIEIACNCITPIPFLKSQVDIGNNIKVPINTFLALFMILRLYVIERFFKYYSIFNNERSKRICELNGFVPNFTFPIKCYLKYKPFTVIYSALIVIIIIFAYYIRLFEKYATTNIEDNKFYSFINANWLVVLAITTVGYGDIFPTIIVGKVITIISIIIGTFIISLAIVSFIQLIEFTNEEQTAYFNILRGGIIKNNKNKNIDTSEMLNKYENYNINDEVENLNKNYNNISANIYQFYFTNYFVMSSIIHNMFNKQLKIENKLLKVLDLNQKIFNYVVDPGNNTTAKNITEVVNKYDSNMATNKPEIEHYKGQLKQNFKDIFVDFNKTLIKLN